LTGWQVSTLCVPDRKFTLSSQRLLNRTIISRLTIALCAPAFALTALAASGGLSASAEAQPVSTARVVSVASSDSSFAFTAKDVAASSAGRLSVMTVDKKTKPKKKKKHHSVHKHHGHHKRHAHLTAKKIAWDIMGWFHWKAKWQFKYLNYLWTRESSWNVYATNPYSGAYGIPQAVPAAKMASCGSDWRTNPKTQIRWGMRYIKAIYGSPKQAWAHEVNDGWY
jgi:hypothetical protein